MRMLYAAVFLFLAGSAQASDQTLGKIFVAATFFGNIFLLGGLLVLLKSLLFDKPSLSRRDAFLIVLALFLLLFCGWFLIGSIRGIMSNL